LIFLARSIHLRRDRALRWLREPSAKPDLVLLDLNLPDKDLNGLAIC
jgi:hypothetical protein